MQIDTIIFDLGGVLIDWNPEYVFRDLIPDAEKRKWFFENVCTMDWNIEQDAGRRLQVATDLLVGQYPDWAIEIRAYYSRWEEMLGGPIHGTVDIFRNLRQRGEHRIYALTNWSNETFPIALERYDFLHWFDGTVVSGDENTRKPFLDIYQILLNRYDVQPENAVFIDDNLHNVRAAKALGIHGIQFISPEQLQADLNKLDILVKG